MIDQTTPHVFRFVGIFYKGKHYKIEYHKSKVQKNQNNFKVNIFCSGVVKYELASRLGKHFNN